jgi:DNA polymerase II small subunit/DNA polymerase delta subunit B
MKENRQLEKENKKLRKNYYNLSKIVETTWGYKASYVNELRDKIAKLEKKLKTVTEGEIIIPIYDEEGKLVMKD